LENQKNQFLLSRPPPPVRPTARCGPRHPRARARTASAPARPSRPPPSSARPHPRASLRHAATAAEEHRRVAAPRLHHPPRVSRGLPLRPRARLHLLRPAHSLARARTSSPPLPSRELELRPRRDRRSAGVKLPHRRAIFRLPAPAAPPRLPSAHARVCAAFRALGELLHASPPTAMAPPCAASRRGGSPLPLSPP
jgi:hypothetical protein